MALDDPLQWVVIAVVAIVFLMYGPKKIPELAKSIGLARREFNNASVSSVAQATPSSSKASSGTPAQPNAPSTGDPLIDTAKRIGLQTEGKTREEISGEVVDRVKRTHG